MSGKRMIGKKKTTEQTKAFATFCGSVTSPRYMTGKEYEEEYRQRMLDRFLGKRSRRVECIERLRTARAADMRTWRMEFDSAGCSAVFSYWSQTFRQPDALWIHFHTEADGVLIPFGEIAQSDPDYSLRAHINEIFWAMSPIHKDRAAIFPGIESGASLHETHKTSIPVTPIAETAASSNSAQTKKGPLLQFPKLEGLRWSESEVEIAFVSDDAIRVKARGRNKTFTYSEAGFKDKRRGSLWDSRWETLRDLAESGRKYLEDKHGATKQAAFDIRLRLRELLQTPDSDPIPYDRKDKRYHLAFTLLDERGGGSS